MNFVVVDYLCLVTANVGRFDLLSRGASTHLDSFGTRKGFDVYMTFVVSGRRGGETRHHPVRPEC